MSPAAGAGHLDCGLTLCSGRQVDDMKMYIAYRRDDNTGPDPGIVFFRKWHCCTATSAASQKLARGE